MYYFPYSKYQSIIGSNDRGSNKNPQTLIHNPSNISMRISIGKRKQVTENLRTFKVFRGEDL